MLHGNFGLIAVRHIALQLPLGLQTLFGRSGVLIAKMNVASTMNEARQFDDADSLGLDV